MSQLEVQRGKKMLISSSGGNAGYAVAYSGRRLKVPVIVVVPSSTSELMIKKIESEGAKVIVAGRVWDEAHAHALTLLRDYPDASYIPPFDHQEIWEGNSTVVEEVREQLYGEKPDAIICAVGGGGLYNGVVLALQRMGWNDVPVVVAETVGAECFNLAIKAGKLVTKDTITSMAKTLGALTVSAKSLELSKVHPTISHVVTDEMAMSACVRFADDHRVLAELSCGAALAIVYEKDLLRKLLPNLNENSKVVIIVCGGQMVSTQIVQEWKQAVAKSGGGSKL